jgi:enamine deaminase RidA (YjgF/YER057c/UK114 family)
MKKTLTILLICFLTFGFNRLSHGQNLTDKHIKNREMNQKVQYINPDGLSKNPAFSQVVTTQGKGKTIYVGGQDAVNAQGEIVGKGDIAEQTEQVMKNLQTALSASGATFDNLIKLSIYIVQGQDLYRGFQASQKYLGNLKNPPAITGFFVAALARPDYLVEVEAIAFIPEK